MFDTPESTPAPKASSWLLPRLVIVAGGGAVFWVLATWLGTLNRMGRDRLEQTATEPLVVRPAPEVPGRYVGTAACAACHPGENAAFSRSGHAHTLRPAGRVPIAQKLDGRTVEDPEKPGVLWSYHLREGQLSVDRREQGKTQTFPIEFCFGSGRAGCTFVTTAKPGRDSLPVGVEHRLSLLSRGEKLGITPGQREGAARIRGVGS